MHKSYTLCVVKSFLHNCYTTQATSLQEGLCFLDFLWESKRAIIVWCVVRWHVSREACGTSGCQRGDCSCSTVRLLTRHLLARCGHGSVYLYLYTCVSYSCSTRHVYPTRISCAIPTCLHWLTHSPARALGGTDRPPENYKRKIPWLLNLKASFH